MLNTSFSPWPSFTAEEADAVHHVLLSNKASYWTGNECRLFEKEFAQYVNKIPNLAQHKEELLKEVSRNPSSDLKVLIGLPVMDIVSSKITPLETKASQSPRDEIKVDLNNASKDDLYAMLRSRKNN